MIKILAGHVLDRLRELPMESVHCVVTSPPYYGLRDYRIEPQVWGGELGCEHDFTEETLLVHQDTGGNWTQAENGPGLRSGVPQTRFRGDIKEAQKRDLKPVTRGFCRRCGAWRGSLGLEPTPSLFIEHMVAVFREVKRVLRKDGTLWLNIGDSYCNSDKWGGGGENAGKHTRGHDGTVPSWEANRRKKPKLNGIKPKDLLGIPWALAFALRDDGWWLRSEITWAKRAPMPESCTDRPTTATEKVFLLTKSARYFYDAEAVKEEQSEGTIERFGASASLRINPGTRVPGRREYNPDRQGEHNLGAGASGKRNLRNFLLLGPAPFAEAHFATFVPRIPEIAILAGTSERGVCPKCGAGWERVISGAKYSPPSAEIGERNVDLSRGDKIRKLDGKSSEWRDAAASRETIGWRPTCSCAAGAAVPATCLDPFLGAGTTALVADRLGRHCIGIELNPKYVEMAERRLRDDAGMFAQIAAE